MALTPPSVTDDTTPGARTRAFFAPSIEPTVTRARTFGVGPLAHHEEDENSALFGYTLPAFRGLFRHGGRGGMTSNLMGSNYFLNSGEYYDAVATYVPAVASGVVTISGASSSGGSGGTSGEYSSAGSSKPTVYSYDDNPYDTVIYDYDTRPNPQASSPYYDYDTGLYDDRRESIDANRDAQYNPSEHVASDSYRAQTIASMENPNDRAAALAELTPSQREVVTDAMVAQEIARLEAEGTTITSPDLLRMDLEGRLAGMYRSGTTPAQAPSPVLGAFDAAAVAVTDRVNNWTGVDISSQVAALRGAVETGVNAYTSATTAVQTTVDNVTGVVTNAYTAVTQNAWALASGVLGGQPTEADAPAEDDLSGLSPAERRAELADRRAEAEVRASGVNPTLPGTTTPGGLLGVATNAYNFVAENAGAIVNTIPGVTAVTAALTTPAATPTEALSETPSDVPAEATPEERRAALADARDEAAMRAAGVDPTRPATTATGTTPVVAGADVAPARPADIVIPNGTPTVRMMDGTRYETWTGDDGSTVVRETGPNGTYLTRRTDTSFQEQAPDGTVSVNRFPNGDVDTRLTYGTNGETIVSTAEGTKRYGADGQLISNTPRVVTPDTPTDTAGVGPDGVLRIGITPWGGQQPAAATTADGTTPVSVTPTDATVDSIPRDERDDAVTPASTTDAATPVVALPTTSGPRSRSRAYAAMKPAEERPAEAIVAERAAIRGVTPVAVTTAGVTPVANNDAALVTDTAAVAPADAVADKPADKPVDAAATPVVAADQAAAVPAEDKPATAAVTPAVTPVAVTPVVVPPVVNARASVGGRMSGPV